MKKTLILNGVKEEYTFEEIYMKYKPYIENLSFKTYDILSRYRAMNVEIAIEREDVFQELSKKFYQSFDKYDVNTGYAFTTFFMGSLKNDSLRIIRDYGRMRNKNCCKTTSEVISINAIKYSGDDSSTDINIEDTIIEPSCDDIINNCIDKIDFVMLLNYFTEEERKIFHYRYDDDLTQMQIAKLVGVTQVQVSRRIAGIKKKIKNISSINKNHFVFNNITNIKNGQSNNVKNEEVVKKRETMIISLDTSDNKDVSNKKNNIVNIKECREEMAIKILKGHAYDKIKTFMLNNGVTATQDFDFYYYASTNGFDTMETYNTIKAILESESYVMELKEKESCVTVDDDNDTTEEKKDKLEEKESMMIMNKYIPNMPKLNTVYSNKFMLEDYTISSKIGMYTIDEEHITIKLGVSNNFITLKREELGSFINDLKFLQEMK